MAKAKVIKSGMQGSVVCRRSMTFSERADILLNGQIKGIATTFVPAQSKNARKGWLIRQMKAETAKAK